MRAIDHQFRCSAPAHASLGDCLAEAGPPATTAVTIVWPTTVG